MIDTQTTAEPYSAPTNEAVAQTIGLTHSAVSRIRAGLRLPSIPVMLNIQEVYGWKVGDQIQAREGDHYAQTFERYIKLHFDRLAATE